MMYLFRSLHWSSKGDNKRYATEREYHLQFQFIWGVSPILIAPSFEAILATRHEALKE